MFGWGFVPSSRHFSSQAFSLITSSSRSLFAKTYRIHRIFNSNTLQRITNVSDWETSKIVLILLAIELVLSSFSRSFLFAKLFCQVIYGVWAAVSVWHPDTVFVDNKYHVECVVSQKIVFYSLLIAYTVVLLVWGAKLAWDTRKDRQEYNESAWIAASVGAISSPLSLSHALILAAT